MFSTLNCFCFNILTLVVITSKVAGFMKDLTHAFDDQTIEFPGAQKFKFIKQFAGLGPYGTWYSANDFSTAEHSGTHMDAPYHFHYQGKTIDEIPIENLIVTGVFVNVGNETDNNPNYTLPSRALEDWEKENGDIPNKSVVLISFGWAKRYPNRTEYLGPSDQELRFPGLSEEAAEWLAKSKKVVGVGVDTPSVDGGNSKEFPVHKILATNDIYGLENVALTPDLPTIFSLIVMPMKIANGTGAPCRIVAMSKETN